MTVREKRDAAYWERRFEWPMFVAALLVIPTVVIDVSAVGSGWKSFVRM
jgi:hypothetical protein